MGNLKSKQDKTSYKDPEGYCFYSASGQEQHVYIKFSESELILSLGQGNSAFKVIKIDKNFKVVSEIPEQRGIIINFCTQKGKSTCALRMETIQEFQMWSNYLKILKRPVWDDSSSMFCKICAKEFNFFRRQHHCRQCGIVVCKAHAKCKVFLPELGYLKKERVCNTCFQNSNAN